MTFRESTNQTPGNENDFERWKGITGSPSPESVKWTIDFYPSKSLMDMEEKDVKKLFMTIGEACPGLSKVEFTDKSASQVEC